MVWKRGNAVGWSDEVDRRLDLIEDRVDGAWGRQAFVLDTLFAADPRPLAARVREIVKDGTGAGRDWWDNWRCRAPGSGDDARLTLRVAEATTAEEAVEVLDGKGLGPTMRTFGRCWVAYVENRYPRC